MQGYVHGNICPEHILMKPLTPDFTVMKLCISGLGTCRKISEHDLFE